MKITLPVFLKVGIFFVFLLLFYTLLAYFSSNGVQAVVSLQENARIITAPASGGGPQVRILDGSGSEITSFFAYPSDYRGEFQVASGDVNGDGENEIVVAPGEGYGPNVRVFTSGGNYLSQFNVYDSGFRGGVNIAVGDIDGDAVAEIITVPTSRGGPNVRIFGYRNGSYVPTTRNFMAYDSSFRGGVNIAVGDIDGDGIDEIVTAPKSKGGPFVRVFGKRGNELKATTPGVMAYDSSFRGGVSLALGDLDGDGEDEIITGPKKGAPHIRIFGRAMNGNDITLLSPGFFAFSTEFRGGINVASGDTDLDGKDEIIASVASEDKPLVRIFNEDGTKVGDDLLAYAEAFKGGTNVASEKIYLKTTDKLIYSQGDGTDNSANAIIQSDKSTKYTLHTQFKLLGRDTTDAYTKFHTTYFGLYLRFQDINNWMRVDFFEAYRPADTFWARLLIKENGAYKPYQYQVDGIDINSLFTDWHSLMVVDNGQTITVKLDNTQILQQDYETAVKAGQKGYMANICTRAMWDKLTLNASESKGEISTINIGKTSSQKYGLDASRSRYAGNARCQLTANPYYELASNSNYSLPSTWIRGDGLWILINDDREVVIEEKEAEPPDIVEIEKVIYAQGDGTDNCSSAIIKSEDSANYILDTKFKLLDYIDTDVYTRFHSTYFGVYLRYEDVLNWSRVDFFTAYRPAGKLYVRLLLHENGSYQSVKSIPIEGYDPANLFASWHDLQIVDTSSNVLVKLDNVEVLNADYSTTVKAGMKGYLSTIATRSVWEDMTVTSTARATSPVTATVNTTSGSRYGLDGSSSRYNSDDRYQISENPNYNYKDNENYSLPSEWSIGDGLWLYMEVTDFL